MVRHPSEIAGALSPERLQVIADQVRRVRLDALESHQPEKGDNAWTFGCICYARTVAALSRLRAIHADWLRVEVEGLACTIFVGEVPIKFYKGDAANPSDRSLSRGLEQAILQGKLSFMEDEYASKTEAWFWLMAIETHEDGTVSNIALFQANRDGETHNLWYIPQAGEAVAVAGIVSDESRRPDGVELPPVEIRPKAVPAKAAEADENDDGGSN